MNWEKIDFGELYLIPSKNGLNRPSRVRGSGFKMINMGELFANDRIKDIPMELVLLNDREMESSNILENDLLFARQSIVLSGAGKCSIVIEAPEITTFESHLIRVRLNQEIANPYFYYYYFKTPLANMTSLVQQGVQSGIRGSELKFLKVIYPPLPTQRKIASILSAYDDLIENNLKRIKLLEEATEIVFKTEFDFFKPSNEVNKLPVGWKVQRADEIFRINIGKTPPREQEEWFNDADSGIKWVSIKDINNSTVYMLNTSETVTENAVNKFNMNVAKIDTVILSFKLTVGKVAITTEEMVTNEAIAHFNIDDETRMNSEFIYFYLKNFPYDSLGSTSSIGTAINSKIVKAMPVLLPPKSVIQEFGKKVKPSFQMIKTLLKQNTKLREARDILLPRLMSGQIEV